MRRSAGREHGSVGFELGDLEHVFPITREPGTLGRGVELFPSVPTRTRPGVNVIEEALGIGTAAALWILTLHAVQFGTSALYARYRPALLRKAERILQNPDDAHDVVQALFLDVLQRGADEPIDLPYLYRAVTNRCLNLLRDRSTRARLLAQHDPALRGPVRVECDERAIGLQLLASLSDRLGDELGELLVYRYFDEMSQEEIAELTKISRKTIGKRLQLIREAVQELLREGGEGV